MLSVRSQRQQIPVADEFAPDISRVNVIVESDAGVASVRVETLSPAAALDGGVFADFAEYLAATDSRVVTVNGQISGYFPPNSHGLSPVRG